MTYQSVILGGTFDHFHKGHVALIQKALTIGNHVTIAVTTDGYVARHKGINQIHPFGVRVNVLKAWIREHCDHARVTIVPIEDAYGPSTNRKYSFDAIVVSEETKIGADRINTKRKTMGLLPLAVITISMVSAKDSDLISSTRVRQGEIDTLGNLLLPTHLRAELKKSFGSLVPTDKIPRQVQADAHAIIITVGDSTTKKFLDLGIKPYLSIIDLQVQRKPFLWDKAQFQILAGSKKIQPIKSGPGFISQSALKAIQEVFVCEDPCSRPIPGTLIVIDGEEDLLVLPVIIEAPLQSIVYYGQPRVGLIRVVVTAEKKKSAGLLLSRFQR